MYRIVTLVVLVSVLCLAFLIPFKISYDLESIGTIYPSEEWKIVQDASGSLLGSHRYNKTGIVGKINSWQFKAGDLSGLELAIRPDSLTRVKMGDTLIRMYSTVILAQILELSTQIQILQSQTTELSTGEKPQTVKEAQAKLDFAQEQVVIREKEYKIAKELLEGGAIPALELAQKENAYHLSKIEAERAAREVQVVDTGTKNETVKVNRTQIDALQKRLDYLRKVNTGYVITAPFDGKVSKIGLPEEVLVLQKTDECVVEIPIRLSDMRYVDDSTHIEITDVRNNKVYPAKILRSGTKSMVLDQKSVGFLTALVQLKPDEEITFGIGAKCVIKCAQLSQIDYLRRILRYNIHS